jgi:hypothetical protein
LDAARPSTTSATAQLISDYHTLTHSDALAFSPLSTSSVEGSIRQRGAEEGHARTLHNAPDSEGAQLARNTPKSFFARSDVQPANNTYFAASTPVILTPPHVLRNEAPAMSGAGNDAPAITPISSLQERSLPDRSKSTASQKDGVSQSHPQVAIQETHKPREQSPERTMATDEEEAHEPHAQLQPPKTRVYFDEFAAQIRLHRQQDRHARVLRLRQESLQKSIALAERLRRVSRVVQDGLVDLSGHNDKAGFARVYHCINELSTNCHSHWRSEVQAHDIPTDRDMDNAGLDDDRKSFVSRLSRDSRKELSRLLHSIRSEPKFLIDRIRNFSQGQLEGICMMPGAEPQPSVLPQYPQIRNSRSQSRRNAVFANSLEDFAMSLERKEPLKFMLCNVFGNDQNLETPEHWLRLDTWSSVCAELYLLDPEKYQKLIDRVLYIFASFRPWRAAERLERYLMDVLQRGAVLLETVDKTPSSSFRSLTSEPLDTPEAELFFEDAIQELICILCEHDGGLPPAALQFASAIIGKLPSEETQSNFRGRVLFQWFFGNFLFSAISCPEVSLFKQKFYTGS